MNLVELKCNKCGAILKVNSELNEISCNYCGNKMIIDDEATLKRIYHNSDGTITLVAENSKFPPRIAGNDPCETVKIIGLATYFISKVV